MVCSCRSLHILPYSQVSQSEQRTVLAMLLAPMLRTVLAPFLGLLEAAYLNVKISKGILLKYSPWHHTRSHQGALDNKRYFLECIGKCKQCMIS